MPKLNAGGAPAMPPGTPEHDRTAVITEGPPLAYRAALWAVTSCAASTARLLWRRRLHLPRGHVGMRLQGSLREPELIPAAVQLAADVDGVVSVVDELTSGPAEPTPGQAEAAKRQA